MVLNIKRKWKKSTKVTSESTTATSTSNTSTTLDPSSNDDLGHLYQYGDDNTRLLVETQLQQTPGNELDDEDLHELQRLNAPVRTGEYVQIGELPQNVENP
jgi:hypothetical protein